MKRSKVFVVGIALLFGNSLSAIDDRSTPDYSCPIDSLFVLFNDPDVPLRSEHVLALYFASEDWTTAQTWLNAPTTYGLTLEEADVLAVVKAVLENPTTAQQTVENSFKSTPRGLLVDKERPIRRSIGYSNGKYDGERTTFWNNGNMKRHDVLKKDSLISGECWNEDGSIAEYYVFEVMPRFPEGEKKLFEYLGNNIRYPKSAQNKNIHGIVIVKF